MISTQLSYHLFHHWTKYKNVQVIGYAWFINQLLKEQLLAEKFLEVNNETEFSEKLDQLSGHYSVVIETEHTFLCAVDIIRSFPVFIQYFENEILITDNILKSGKWNEAEERNFQNVYCTLENETLLDNCKQIQAGEYAIVEKTTNKITFKAYFRHSSETEKKASSDELIQQEHELVKKIVQYAANRTILIPLSGGYDSRYLLALLTKYNYSNIACYTYGRKDSHEVITAQSVAKALNAKWIFIEYTDQLLDIFLEDEWNNYSSINHHYSSLPHEQDFFALYYLKQHNLLPENAVVMNGFCQDILAGSFLENKNPFNIREHIFYKHGLRLSQIPYSNSWNGYQEWLIKNRLSKFIVNSIRVYEYFGLDFYLPFWDKKWVQFWVALKHEDRLVQSFYITYLFDGLLKQYSITHKKRELSKNSISFQLRKYLKLILPDSIVNAIQHYQNKQKVNDSNNTLFLYNKVYNSLLSKPKIKDFRINNIHAQYLLEKLKQNQEL